MRIEDVCRLVSCERFHVYLAIRKKVIVADKDEVGRYSFSSEEAYKLVSWYDKLRKRRRRVFDNTIRKAYLYGNK